MYDGVLSADGQCTCPVQGVLLSKSEMNRWMDVFGQG